MHYYCTVEMSSSSDGKMTRRRVLLNSYIDRKGARSHDRAATTDAEIADVEDD